MRVRRVAYILHEEWQILANRGTIIGLAVLWMCEFRWRLYYGQLDSAALLCVKTLWRSGGQVCVSFVSFVADLDGMVDDKAVSSRGSQVLVGSMYEGACHLEETLRLHKLIQ